MTPDFIIVGGGLIGLLTARELRAAGASVVIFERGRLGGEASWAGGGILSPLYPWRYPRAVTALAAWGQQAYPNLAAALTEQTGIDAEWTRSGMLILDATAADAAAAEAWCDQHDGRIEALALGQCDAIAPALSGRHLMAALWLPDIAQIRNPRLIQALHSDLLKQGVQVHEAVEVRELLVEQGQLRGVRTEQGEWRSGAVVVAGGAWSAGLFKPIGLTLPLAPVRGQMLLLRADPGLLTAMVMRQYRYLIPRRDGRILVGSTLEQTGFDKTTTQDAAAGLHASALALLPGLSAYPIERQWAGLRPGTPTGVPYIGTHPALSGLYVCTGHYRNGVVLGPASARLLADLALGRPPLLDPAPYSLPLSN